MYTGEFSHQGDSCTFEVLADRFGLKSAAVVKVGRVVHDLDMKDAKYGHRKRRSRPDGGGPAGAACRRSRRFSSKGSAMFDALARSFESDDRSRGCAQVQARKASADAISRRRK